MRAHSPWPLTALLLALTALPSLSAARGRHADFEALDLAPREARRLADPVVMDRIELERRLDALARELDAVRRDAQDDGWQRNRRNRRNRRDRRDLQRSVQGAAAELVALKKAVQGAHRVQLVRRPVEPPPATRPAVAQADQMTQLMQSLEAASFRDDKLRVLRSAAAHHHFTCEQAATLARKLSFGKDQVDALVLLFPKVVDPENSHTFYSVLAHKSDREALDARLDAL